MCRTLVTGEEMSNSPQENYSSHVPCDSGLDSLGGGPSNGREIPLDLPRIGEIPANT